MCPKRAFIGATFAANQAASDVPDLRFRFEGMRLTTIEIVPSIEFQKALLDLQMSKGYFVYPTYSIQGQQVDIQSANISTPIDAAGSRVEYTDITFINEGKKQIATAPAATLIGNEAYLWAHNELFLAGSAGDPADLRKSGSKHIRFLPKINKMSIEIAGQEYPGCSTFDNVGNNPQRAYKFYKESFKGEDEELVPLRDWMF